MINKICRKITIKYLNKILRNRHDQYLNIFNDRNLEIYKERFNDIDNDIISLLHVIDVVVNYKGDKK